MIVCCPACYAKVDASTPNPMCPRCGKTWSVEMPATKLPEDKAPLAHAHPMPDERPSAKEGQESRSNLGPQFLVFMVASLLFIPGAYWLLEAKQLHESLARKNRELESARNWASIESTTNAMHNFAVDIGRMRRGYSTESYRESAPHKQEVDALDSDIKSIEQRRDDLLFRGILIIAASVITWIVAQILIRVLNQTNEK